MKKAAWVNFYYGILWVVVCPFFLYGDSSKDTQFNYWGFCKPEMFYGKNTNYLNNRNAADKQWYERTILGFTADFLYGSKTYGVSALEFLLTFWTKVVWGNPESIARTTDTTVRFLEVVTGSHNHGIPRSFFWVREMWVRVDLDVAFSLPTTHKHTLTLGAFPFELGRGISLGDAYAVGPEVLGFYSDNLVDQYAFGAKLSGNILQNLSYDAYGAILQNKSSGFSDTGSKILGQKYGRLKSPERGFGKINFLTAARLIWYVLDSQNYGKLRIEPYVLFNHDPEQEIDFLGDSASKLGTIGLASEYFGESVEFGFDCAFNIGHQQVFGWDRNTISFRNTTGQPTVVNTQVNAVIDAEGDTVLAPYIAGSESQSIIDTAFRDQTENGAEIGSVPSIGFLKRADGQNIILKNSKKRFRNPYKNRYEGWMFVSDFAWWIYKKDLQITATIGATSGGDNPNIFHEDEVYTGFIPLQEIYSGKRVKSAFLLSGAGKVKRPLSTPSEDQVLGVPFPDSVSGFTNLVFFGTGLNYVPKSFVNAFKFNPNILAYWEEFQIGRARTFLGVESNLFMYYSLMKDLEVFMVGSIFFPGSFYADRGELPPRLTMLTPQQEHTLAEPEVTGSFDRIPGLGQNAAFTFNVGMKYMF